VKSLLPGAGNICIVRGVPSIHTRTAWAGSGVLSALVTRTWKRTRVLVVTRDRWDSLLLPKGAAQPFSAMSSVHAPSESIGVTSGWRYGRDGSPGFGPVSLSTTKRYASGSAPYR